MIDVRASRELQAAIIALRLASRDVTRDVNTTTRRTAKPMWQAELAKNVAQQPAKTRAAAQAVYIRGARVAVSPKQISLKTATSTKPLRRGLVPATEWAGLEFGMRTRQTEEVRRSRRGRRYRTEVWVGRQFRGRVKNGLIAFDAASRAGVQIVTAWVHIIVNKFAAAAEGRNIP